jgi:hypothetical protein
MKLASLVNLKPLKEDLSRASIEELEALARQAQDIQDSEAGYAQQQGDFDSDKFGNEFADQKVMPYGGEYYSMNDIQDAIATRLDKSGDVPYDVAIGRMTQDEYDKYMSTVAKDKATFTKSSKFDRMNETNKNMKNLKEVYSEMYENKEYSEIEQEWDKLSSDEHQSIIDDVLSGEARYNDYEKSFDELKSDYGSEFTSAIADYVGIKTPEVNEMFPNRQGPRKVNLDSIADVDNTGWTPDGGGGSIGYAEWEDGTEMTPQEIQDYFEVNHELYDDIMQGLAEGSCGYGPDGVPGDTPGETKGMDADDRTRGMLKMLIKKEIAKLHENK